MTMITPSYLGETIEYSSLHACRSTLEDPTWSVAFWTVDAAMAIMLILLAAVEEGVGAWYFGISRGEKDVVRELGVPDSCIMLGAIALGYPSDEDKPRTALFAKRRRPFEEMFHTGRW